MHAHPFILRSIPVVANCSRLRDESIISLADPIRQIYKSRQAFV